MSNDLETMIETTLRRHAADAPTMDGDELIAGAQRRAVATRQRRRVDLTVMAIVVAALLVAAVMLPGRGNTPAEPPPTAVIPPFNASPNGTGLIYRGNDVTGGPQPPTLVVYQDFQCPSCRHLFVGKNAMIDQLAEKGLVTIELRTMTILDSTLGNDSSARSAQAAACAADQRFYTGYVAALYTNQPTDERAGFSEQDLRVTFAQQAGMSAAALSSFQACYDSKKMVPFVSAVAARAHDVDHVETTPTLTVNGKSPMWKDKTGAEVPWWQTLGTDVEEWMSAITQIASGGSTPPAADTSGYGVAKELPMGRETALAPRAEVLKSGQVRIVLPGGTAGTGVLLPQRQGQAAVGGMSPHPKAIAGGGAVVVQAKELDSRGQISADVYLVTSSGARRLDLTVASEVMVDPTKKTGMVLALDRAKNATKVIPTKLDLTTGAVLEAWPALELQTQLMGWTAAGVWVRGAQGVSLVSRQGKATTPSAEVIKLDRFGEAGKTRVKALILGERGLCQVSWDDGAQVPDLKSVKPDFCIPTKKKAVEVRVYQPQPDGSVLVVFHEEPFGPNDRRAVLVSASNAVADLTVPPALRGDLVEVVGDQAGLLGAAEPDGCTLWRVNSEQSLESVMVRWCVDGTVQRVPLKDDTEYLL